MAIKHGLYRNEVSSLAAADYPHLRALELYLEKWKPLNEQDPVLSVWEVKTDGSFASAIILLHDDASLQQNEARLSGKADDNVLARILLVEDLSGLAIEALGGGLSLDPNIFYFHLGFDTRRSILLDTTKAAEDIPILWYFPEHGPDGFTSIPVPCEIETDTASTSSHSLAQQEFRPVCELVSSAKRAFYRISVVKPQSEVPTIILLGFPSSSFLSLKSPSCIDVHLSKLDRKGGSAADELMQSIVGNDARETVSYELLHERVLLWMYSRVSIHYHISSQSDGRVWRKLRAAHSSKLVTANAAQKSKKAFLDTSTKLTELLSVAQLTLDLALHDIADRRALEAWQRKTRVLVEYQQSRLRDIRRSIQDVDSFL